MSETHHKAHIRVGQRNIKTALSAALCALLYFLVDKNPTFACIGAIFGVGSDMGNSRLNGGNRFFGTVIGGVLGMGLFRLYIMVYPDGNYHLLMIGLLFVGVVVLIVLSQLLRWPGGIQPGGVVLCIILFNTPVDSYISYSINRMIDTGIGVLVALLINWVFSQERVARWHDKLWGHKCVWSVPAEEKSAEIAPTENNAAEEMPAETAPIESNPDPVEPCEAPQATAL